MRRRIIRILIMLGSAGLTSSIATLIIAFAGQKNEVIPVRGAVLLIELLLVYLFAQSKLIYKFTKKIIRKFLQKHYQLLVIDYQEILGLSKGYSIAKFKVDKDSWLADKSIKSLDIRREGVLVFSIKRKIGNQDEIIGAPTADIVIKPGDELVCYGKSEAIKNLSERIKGKAGDQQHKISVAIEQNNAKLQENILLDAEQSAKTKSKPRRRKKHAQS